MVSIVTLATAAGYVYVVEKLAAVGELADFSPQDLIDMLNGGLTVADLLDVIGYCLHDKRKPHA